MNFEAWEKTVPASITSDRLWTVKAYRLGLFASSLGWHDVSKLVKDSRTISLADQLYRSLGSVHANYAEGYSYSTGGNRAKHFEYSLGSARESRGWYFDGRFVLGNQVSEHRMALLARSIQILIVTVSEQRTSTLREEQASYDVNDPELTNLLTNVPISIDS